MQGQNQAAIGHNNPPSDIEILQSKLKDAHEPLLAGGRELINKAKELVKSTPITDDEQCGLYSDLKKDIANKVKELDTTRVGEIAPHLTAQRTIQSFFMLPIETLKTTATALNQALTGYLTEKENKERQRLAAEAEEKRKAAAAQLNTAVELEGAGMNKLADNSLNKAQVNNQAAVKLEAQAAAKPAELSRTRGGSSLATLKTKWVGKMLDRNQLDKEKLWAYFPEEALQKAINAFVNAGGRELAGASIYEDKQATTR